MNELKNSFYAIFNGFGFVKATKRKGVVKPKEIQIKLNIKIPEKAFSKPSFEANLEIREDQLPDIVQELVIELLELKSRGSE